VSQSLRLFQQIANFHNLNIVILTDSGELNQNQIVLDIN
jgi:hypothetical protein